MLSFQYPKQVHFKCERCAICCGDTEHRVRTILLMKTEANQISRSTSTSVDEFADRTRNPEPYTYRMKKTADGKCVFLRGNVCRIYKVRPLICRFYPFELKRIAEGKHAFAHTDECPSIGKGPELRKTYFERLFAKSKKTIEKNQRKRVHQD